MSLMDRAKKWLLLILWVVTAGLLTTYLIGKVTFSEFLTVFLLSIMMSSAFSNN